MKNLYIYQYQIMMRVTYNISVVMFSIWIFFLVAFSIKYICWDHSWNPPLNDFNEEILLLQEFDCWTRKSLSVMSRSSNICWSLIDVSIFFFFINWRIFSLAFSTPEKKWLIKLLQQKTVAWKCILEGVKGSISYFLLPSVLQIWRHNL